MLGVIQNNPYRLLGVYSNSPAKERVANLNKLRAFLKVGRDAELPLDECLDGLLAPLSRTVDSVSDAEAKLALPLEQLRHAQFWFMKVTALDDIAMNRLAVGEVHEAMAIWDKKECASSLQNHMVCALLLHDDSAAVACAERLYSQYAEEFVRNVLGDSNVVDAERLGYRFLDELCDAEGAMAVLRHLRDGDWRQHVCSKTIKPLVEELQSAIDVAKATRRHGAAARYAAGVKLMDETKATLDKLKAMLPSTDLQYQMIADKLGIEILQCGIDYYNGSDDANSAHKAMRLQSYAQSIVVGEMAKDRCDENVGILQKIIDKMPPEEVVVEFKAIESELVSVSLLAHKIQNAMTLLTNTKQHLQSMKAKLGAADTSYLGLSTMVVNCASHYVVEEVNGVQERSEPINVFKDTLKAAWKVMLVMGDFDMMVEYKTSYDHNRATLKKMCERWGISTSYGSSFGGAVDVRPDWEPKYGRQKQDERVGSESYPLSGSYSSSSFGRFVACVIFFSAVGVAMGWLICSLCDEGEVGAEIGVCLGAMLGVRAGLAKKSFKTLAKQGGIFALVVLGFTVIGAVLGAMTGCVAGSALASATVSAIGGYVFMFHLVSEDD